MLGNDDMDNVVRDLRNNMFNSKHPSKYSYETSWGYGREGSASGLIPSPNKAREIACENSVDARINAYTKNNSAKLFDLLRKACDDHYSKNYEGGVMVIDSFLVKGSAGSVDVYESLGLKSAWGFTPWIWDRSPNYFYECWRGSDNFMDESALPSS